MFRSVIISLCVAVTLAGSMSTAVAQQFRVFTRVERVYSDDNNNEHTELMARSITYFYAGRVYDCIPQVGEITIFEPSHDRFVVINTVNMLVTTVPFDEISRRLDQAREETKSYALRLRDRSPREATQIAEPLLFQLTPKFQEQFDPAMGKLILSSPRFTYLVDSQSPAMPECGTAYLNYADWAARLNHVLHPHSLYPEPRLQLNQALRAHQQIPAKVQLRVAFDKPLHLQAEHRFDWELLNRDRQDISHWEMLLKSDKLKEVSFPEYQKSIVLAAGKR